MTRGELEEAYVNYYRRAWDTNSGLTTEKIKEMTDDELRKDTRSLKEISERR